MYSSKLDEWKAAEPVDPTIYDDKLKAILISGAKIQRAEIVTSNISLLGGEWQVASKDMDSITEATQVHNMKGLGPEVTIG